MAAKDKLRPSVEIELDKKRTMVMDFNALAEMEDVLGESALDGTIFTQEKLSKARYLRAIVYGCLKAADESVTLEQVGKLLSVSNVGEVIEKVAELMTASVGSDSDEGEAGKKGKS